MEILAYIQSIIIVIIFGFVQHLNFVKISNVYVRILVALLVFSYFDLAQCIFLYMFGFDYALFVMYQYNTKGTGLNVFYPELNKIDRFAIWLIVKYLKRPTVSFTILFDYYVLCLIYILIHILNLVIKQCL